MRKIDKNTCLSENYKQWEEMLADPHPRYDSSNNAYYKDIVMSLLHCQDGLCAYTERRLCPPALYTKEHWVKNEQGYLHYLKVRPDHFGQLDHFDPKLKEKTGWSWDNFFMIDSDINRKEKSNHVPDPLLKPDHQEYDPDKLFLLQIDYRFTAHPSLDPSEQKRVADSMTCLGINFGPVVDARRRSVEAWRKARDFGVEEAEEYPTARRMLMAREPNLAELSRIINDDRADTNEHSC